MAYKMSVKWLGTFSSQSIDVVYVKHDEKLISFFTLKYTSFKYVVHLKRQCPFVCLSVCLYSPFFFDTTVGLQPNLAHIFG